MRSIVTAVATALLLAACAGHEPKSSGGDDGEGDEQAIAVSAVPQGVRDAVAAAYPGATASEWEREEDDGKVFFEVELKLSGAAGPRALDVKLGSDGRIVEEEEMIAVSALPATVLQGLKGSAYAAFTVTKAERIVLDGKHDAPLYELDLSHEGHRAEILVNAQGKPLKQKSESDEEDEDGEDHD